MERLGALEIDFARAVLDASAEVPAPLTRQTGGTPSRRFGVYRNNVYASLIEALTGRFPVVARLVGDEFFRGMARVYIERDPPRSPVLLCYGEGFPAFVAQFPPAVAVPYLADVARLEWAWHAAYHTADAAPLSLAALKKAAGGAEDVALTLHPSLSVVRSAWPVITIWQINAADGAPGRAQLPPGGEDALVARPRLDVEVRRLPAGGAIFVLAVKGGATLQEAAARAMDDAPAFDLAANLAGLMASGAIVGAGARSAKS
jgi:hypothetical protein